MLRDFIERMKPRDLAIRFCAGGAAVVMSYIIAKISPWKAFGGMFAAFPAVLTAAVVMSGMEKGKVHGADVALGAVAGMLGGTVCVLAALLLVPRLDSWQLGIALALVVWSVSAAIFSRAVGRIVSRNDRADVKEPREASR